MKYMPALVVFVICSSLLSLKAQASNTEDALTRGLEKLYLQELDRYLACREESTESCWFGEVESYGSNGLKKPEKIKPAIYPRSAQQNAYAAVVENSISINGDGSVESVEVLYCSSGRGILASN